MGRAGSGATLGCGIYDASGGGIDGGHGTSGSRRDGKKMGDDQAERRGRRSGADGTQDGERDRVSATDIAVAVLGPETPVKKQIQSAVKAMGVKLLSPVECNFCPHICLEEIDKTQYWSQLSQHGNDEVVKDFLKSCFSHDVHTEGRPKSQRALSFDFEENADLIQNGEEEDIRRRNHQLFLCSSDLSSYVTLQTYADHRRNELVVRVITPGATATDHKSRSTRADIKAAIREVYMVLKCLHHIGVSLGGRFDSTNFVIDEAKGHTNARVSIQYGILTRSSPESCDRDLKSFILMIRRQVFTAPPLPHDINFWLSLVGREEYEDMLPFHIALGDDESGISHFMRLYDKFKCLEKDDPDAHNEIIKALEEYNNWKGVFDNGDGNDYLQDTIDFINGETKRTTDYESHVGGLLHLLRNCKNHSASELLQDFMLVVGHEYPNIIYDFQHEMFKKGYKTGPFKTI